MKVLVALALADRQHVVELDLPEDSTARDAIVAARLETFAPGLDPGRLRIGIWSRLAKPGTRLREGDRVELYRPLVADPKHERRVRAKAGTTRR